MKSKTKELENINKIYEKGDVQKAIELCQIGLQNDPTNADLHICLGDLYLAWHLDIYNSFQYIDEAITEYQRALETYIDSAEVYFKIGQAQFYKGDLDKAINYLNMALKKDEKHHKAYYLLAETYTKKARFTDAIEYAKKAIKYRPFRNSCAHFLLYNLYKLHAFRNIKKGLNSNFELLLSLFTLPFDKQALKNVFRAFSYMRFFPILMHGYYQIQTRGMDQAIDIYIQAIEEAPGFVPLYCLLGDIYRSIGEYEDAIAEYKTAIWLDCLNIQAYRHLCQTYEEQGDYDNAIEVYKKLITILPTIPEFHSNLANIYYLKGDIKEAISHYQAAITLNPNKHWTSIISQTLGYVHQQSGKDLDAAISAYQSAYLLTPEDIDIYVNLGSAFYDKEDYDNALAVYRMALELEPTNAKIHCNLGFLHWGKGDTDEAIKEYELAIEYDKTYDIAYNNLGVIYLDDLGRVQQAVELFTKAVEYNPNYALAHFNLARAITIKGDKIEAAKLYQVAQEINKVTNELNPQDITDKINDLFQS
ncbi:MAG: tetratricopeptide repeat protein [Candidatus Gastranaerophilales bacterium]|nr:tetratricopeptide repeat protein [Candidatus Gastranaerophilales bacterium]